MGNCVSMNKLPENMFHVTSISDDKRLGDKGMMQVTEIELIYTDRRTSTSWRWPLKFLRKYGCDGEVFSFEAGRKCPGGEGLYAFSAKRASQIFDMVARNINQGGLQPPAGELSPFPSEGFPPDQNTLISHRSSSRSPTHNHTDQPNYANMDLSGKPLVEVENGMDPALPPRPVAYKEVVFEQPPEQHPLPRGDKEQKTSYTRIDFTETENYNRERRLGTLPELQFNPQGRPSTSSVSGVPSSRPEKSGKRQRIHTFSGPGGSSGRSPSESSFSSQGSLTDSTRDVRPSLSSPLTGQSHVSLEGPPTALYQNVVMSKEAAMGTNNLPHSHQHHQHQHTPHPPQQQYQNVSVGAGSVRDVFSPMSASGGSGLTSRSASQSAANPCGKASNGISPVIVNGDPMAHYADLELGNTPRTRATSTPVGGKAPNLSYSVMEFTKDGKSSPNHSFSVVPQPSAGNSSPTKTVNGDIRGSRNPHHLPPLSSMAEEPPESNVTVVGNTASPTTVNGHTTVRDETKVEYGVLNFPVMATLEKLKGEHRKEKEREHSHPTGSKKKDKK